jgi:hypothetical protein
MPVGARFRSSLTLLVLAALGCGSRAANPNSDCGAIELLPPIVNVLAFPDDTPICDATFTVVGSPDGGVASGSDPGAVRCDETRVGGCPSRPDGAASWCPIALLALAGKSGDYTVGVSRAGFDAAVLGGVRGGVGGCAPEMTATNQTVVLRATAASGPAGALVR